MTGRTTPHDHNLRHALRVLDGGLSTDRRQLDETADLLDPARLAEEIAEAARLCDRLEADGLRIAFELDGSERGLRIDVQDEHGHNLQRVAISDVADVARLATLTGTNG